MIALPIISNDPRVQSAYESMRRNGQSHNMAEMLATRSLPGLKTDTRFAARLKRGGDTVHPAFVAKAKAAGVSVDGKKYMHQLAMYPGDPKAWVSDRSDVKRICEQRGWGCSGSVDVPLPTQEIDTDEKPYMVCEESVNREIAEIAEKDPGAVSTKKKREELRHKTRERMSGRG